MHNASKQFYDGSMHIEPGANIWFGTNKRKSFMLYIWKVRSFNVQIKVNTYRIVCLVIFFLLITFAGYRGCWITYTDCWWWRKCLDVAPLLSVCQWDVQFIGTHARGKASSMNSIYCVDHCVLQFVVTSEAAACSTGGSPSRGCHAAHRTGSLSPGLHHRFAPIGHCI